MGQAEFVATEMNGLPCRMPVALTPTIVARASADGALGRTKSGRFEGWEVFHLGMALDQNTFERSGAFGQGDVFNPGASTG